MSKNSSPATSDLDLNCEHNFEKISNPDEAEDVNQKEDLIEDFDNNLPDTVTLLKSKNGSKVYLIGTAHFSQQSQCDVVKVIQNVQPNLVVVELCMSRINILRLDEKTLLEEASSFTFEKIMDTIKENGILNGIIYILLLNISAGLTKKLGVAPGGEFRTAFTEALNIDGCVVHLGDRPIQITIERALARLNWYKTLVLFWQLITSNDSITHEEMERSKNRDMLDDILADMAHKYPDLKEVFVHERDIYLTHSLQTAAELDGPQKVVGVVGMGHVPGIQKLWPEPQAQFIKSILVIPQPTMCSKIVRFSFKLSLLGAGIYLICKFVPGAKKIPNKCSLLFQNICLRM